LPSAAAKSARVNRVRRPETQRRSAERRMGSLFHRVLKGRNASCRPTDVYLKLGRYHGNSAPRGREAYLGCNAVVVGQALHTNKTQDPVRGRGTGARRLTEFSSKGPSPVLVVRGLPIGFCASRVASRPQTRDVLFRRFVRYVKTVRHVVPVGRGEVPPERWWWRFVFSAGSCYDFPHDPRETVVPFVGDKRGAFLRCDTINTSMRYRSRGREEQDALIVCSSRDLQ